MTITISDSAKALVFTCAAAHVHLLNCPEHGPHLLTCLEHGPHLLTMRWSSTAACSHSSMLLAGTINTFCVCCVNVFAGVITAFYVSLIVWHLPTTAQGWWLVHGASCVTHILCLSPAQLHLERSTLEPTVMACVH
jgi:hypothetical protein